MFKTLQKFFGKTEPVPASRPSARTDDSPAAPEHAPAAAGFLRREPVFDRRGRLAGHLLGVHAPEEQPAPALLDVLGDALAGGHTALVFVPLAVGDLWSPAVDRLEGTKTVLLVDLSGDVDAEALALRIDELQAGGRKLAFLRRPEHPAFTACMARTDLAAIDYADSDPDAVRNYSAAVRASERAQPMRLFACHIDTTDDHRFCHQWHYDLFHGNFARIAPCAEQDAADPHKLHLMHLLRLVRNDADNVTVAEAMKQDPLLSFRILRYLNSPLIGLAQPIDSLNHALTIMGRQRLTRWLSVLLFSVREPGFGDWLLVESALTRARLMEMLGGRRQGDAANDELFMTGMFSCLERLLHRPLAALLDDIPVSAAVRAALLQGSGPYAALLAVAEAADSYDLQRIEAAAQAAGVTPDVVNSALLGAIAWASEVTEHWE